MYLCNVRQGLLLHIPTKPWDSQCLTLIFIQNGKNRKDIQRKEIHLPLQWRGVQEFHQGLQVCLRSHYKKGKGRNLGGA